MKLLLLFLLMLSSLSLLAESEIEQLKKQVRELQEKTGGQNLKFSADYRATYDDLDYKTASGKEYRSNNLLSNRFIVNAGYKYNDNLSFSSALAYNKMFGDTARHSQRANSAGTTDFDWIINENPNDNGLKVKEVFLLYQNKSFLGFNKLPWSFSIGRRPSTNGFLGNHREGFEEAKSPLAHSINVEFDGVSLKWELDKLTGVSGMDFKICSGRGLTNARPRFDDNGLDYSYDETKDNANIDFIGIIFTPFNNGQYNLKTQAYKAYNLIGYDSSDYPNFKFKDFGDLTNLTVSFEVNGIGDMINDYLDQVTLFASYSMSETDPANGMSMLGTAQKKKGSSLWVGAIVPGFLDGDSFGVEYNQGTKYWRSFTYGEDTLIGSKIAARGKAIEAYYNLPLIDTVLTFQLRYTYIDYEYTGSNGFFGNYSGTPMTMAQAKAAGGDPVTIASALRGTLRYRF